MRLALDRLDYLCGPLADLGIYLAFICLAFGGGGEASNDPLQRHGFRSQIVDDAGVPWVFGMNTCV